MRSSAVPRLLRIRRISSTAAMAASAAPPPSPDVEDLGSNGIAVSYHAYSATERGQLRSQLLSWYDAEQRELPWRQGSVSVAPTCMCMSESSIW